MLRVSRWTEQTDKVDVAGRQSGVGIMEQPWEQRGIAENRAKGLSLEIWVILDQLSLKSVIKAGQVYPGHGIMVIYRLCSWQSLLWEVIVIYSISMVSLHVSSFNHHWYYNVTDRCCFTLIKTGKGSDEFRVGLKDSTSFWLQSFYSFIWCSSFRFQWHPLLICRGPLHSCICALALTETPMNQENTCSHMNRHAKRVYYSNN